MQSQSGSLSRVAVLLAVAAVMMAACGPEAPSGPRAWIDTPREGSELPLGQEVEVRSHAYAAGGVAAVELFVDGELYRREPPGDPGASFSGLSQTWMAEAVGDHVLHVVAYDASGRASEPVMVRVRVVAAVAIAGPTITPTFTPTITVTRTGTAIPPLQMNVWVDRPDLQPGECTVLHWEIDHATAVLLDGQAVPDHGTRQICPAVTTSYRFRVEAAEGAIERTVMVTVSAPAESDPPVITGITASADRIFLPNCQPNTVTISANVTDASGVARVELSYRVVEGSRQGQWRTLTMAAAGGRYQVTLDWAALDASLHPPVTSGATIEYAIRASDARGNTAQSRTLTVEYEYCLI